MRRENRQVAERIAQKIVKEVEGTETSFSLIDLVDSGVDGDLLVEVVEILNRSDFIVDLNLSDFWQKVASKNITECSKALVWNSDPATAEELKLLKEEPRIFVGCKFDRYSDTRMEADTGIPLMIRKYTKNSKALLQDAIREDSEFVMIENSIKLLTRPKYEYEAPN